MLKKLTDSAQTMTIQNLNTLDSDAMQNLSDKSNNVPTSKNGHISFSVASLLADTRPTESSPGPAQQSSDEEYDSNQEDSIVDVEDLQAETKEDVKDNDILLRQRESVLNQGPIRPTPFSALAAAVYQAAHPNWSHQGLVNPFVNNSPMFQGPTSFGVPNLSSGM